MTLFFPVVLEDQLDYCAQRGNVRRDAEPVTYHNVTKAMTRYQYVTQQKKIELN
jgi:hypothetical protein